MGFVPTGGLPTTIPGPITVLHGAHVMAPEDLGRQDVLVLGGRIAAIAPEIDSQALPSGWPSVEVHNLTGLLLVPGLVDAHEHLTGGGGEGGPATRTPEVTLTMLTTAGVTTVVGCLGTDGTTRDMRGLLAKAYALESEGVTTRIWTGAYEVPPPTLTGSVRGDIVLIDKVIGCGEVAVSDHRSAQPTLQDIRRLAAECRVGGMLGGKPGILHLHVGSGRRGIEDVFAIIAEGEIPAAQFIPTHMGRTQVLSRQAAELTRAGGRADFTAGPGCSQSISEALAHGADATRLSVSSDGGGSLPRFGPDGALAGLQVGSPSTLLATVRDLATDGVLSLEQALALVTSNPANAIGLGETKGTVAVGADADLVAIDQAYQVRNVWARGRLMVSGGQPVVFGTFEPAPKH